MLEANPDYVSTLAALPRITRERLLYGNWLAREEGSGYFKRSWTPIDKSIDIFNGDDVVRRVRAWDLASTLPSEAYPDPDYTCLLYTSPSPRDRTRSRMPSSA